MDLEDIKQNISSILEQNENNTTDEKIKLIHSFIDKEHGWKGETSSFECPSCKAQMDFEQDFQIYCEPTKCSCGFKGAFTKK